LDLGVREEWQMLNFFEMDSKTGSEMDFKEGIKSGKTESIFIKYIYDDK